MRVNKIYQIVTGPEPEKIVETLRELFQWETNGEVLYWGVQILDEQSDVPGA